jgi:hypothetical protein
MRAALLQGNIVVNIVEVENLDVFPNLVDATTSGAIGDTYKNGEFISQEYVKPAEENKRQAVELLKQTDWVELPSVADPTQSNPYLENQAEFIAWRSKVRAIAVNPIDGDVSILDEIPQEVWKTV